MNYLNRYWPRSYWNEDYWPGVSGTVAPVFVHVGNVTGPGYRGSVRSSGDIEVSS